MCPPRVFDNPSPYPLEGGIVLPNPSLVKKLGLKVSPSLKEFLPKKGVLIGDLLPNAKGGILKFGAKRFLR